MNRILELEQLVDVQSQEINKLKIRIKAIQMHHILYDSCTRNKPCVICSLADCPEGCVKHYSKNGCPECIPTLNFEKAK
jgi:hypothetical protein